MKRLIEYPLEDGGTILVEVDEPEIEAGLVEAAIEDEIIARAQQSFEGALAIIRPTAATFVKNVKSIADKPDEIEVEFGIKLSAEAGAFLAAAGAEANFKITLTWKEKEEKKV